MKEKSLEVPWESIPGASASFLDVNLRLLMKEREDLMARVVELDEQIWGLEERLRERT